MGKMTEIYAYQLSNQRYQGASETPQESPYSYRVWKTVNCLLVPIGVYVSRQELEKFAAREDTNVIVQNED